MSHPWAYAGGIVLGAVGGRSRFEVDPLEGEVRRFQGGEIVMDRTGNHYLLIGKTGGGKGIGVVGPTLLPGAENDWSGWLGSVLLHDRKGELWDDTARQRSKFSHVLRFDPTDDTGVRWNPLMEIRRGKYEIRDAMNLAELLPNPEGNIYEGDTIWDNVSMDYVTGALLFLINFAPPEWKCLGGLRRFMELGPQAGKLMQENAHPDPDIRREIRGASVRLWKNENERYVGSVMATINSYLRIYGDPIVAAATGTSDFRTSDLQCADHPVSLYLVVRPSDAERLRPLLKMLLVGAQRSLMYARYVSVDGRAKKHKLLVLLDEFTTFGKVGDMEYGMTDMRGYGIRAMPVVQSYSGIRKVYGRDNLFFNNARQAVLTPEDIDEQKEVEQRLGDVEVTKTSHSKSRRGASAIISSGQGSSVSSSTQTRWEPLIRAADMKTTLKGKVVVFGPSKPMVLEQLTAPFDPRWAGLYGNPPSDLRDDDDRYFDSPSEPWNPWLTWRVGDLTEKDFEPQPDGPSAQPGNLKAAVTKALKAAGGGRAKTKKETPAAQRAEPEWASSDGENEGHAETQGETQRWVS
jgi:type IV secretion system protein VirD4